MEVVVYSQVFYSNVCHCLVVCFVFFFLNVHVEKLESPLNLFVIMFCWVRILANKATVKVNTEKCKCRDFFLE